MEVGWDVPDLPRIRKAVCTTREAKEFLREAICGYDRPFDRLLRFSCEAFHGGDSRDDRRLSGSCERTIVFTGDEHEEAFRLKQTIRADTQLCSTRWLRRMSINDLLSAAVNAHG